MGSGYFDTPVDYGFSLRTFWEESGGVVTIPDIQLWSGNYPGIWYPGGSITINGEEVLKMNLDAPATHSFLFGSVDTWAQIQKQSGQALPVRSTQITGGTAEITVDVTLYRDSSSPRPRLTGSVTIDVASVLAQAFDGAAFRTLQAVAGDGAAFHKYRPIIHDGAAWTN